MFEWITTMIERVGPWGVGLLMFLENVFPPIPSELIMPLAGFNAAQVRMSLGAAMLAGTIGSLAGASLWYLVGRAIGAERIRRLARRHGRWLTLSVDDIDRAQAWFDRRGTLAVLLGRLLPGIRTLISIPAGLARMPFLKFLAWSAVGTAVVAASAMPLAFATWTESRTSVRYVGAFAVVFTAASCAWIVRSAVHG